MEGRDLYYILSLFGLVALSSFVLPENVIYWFLLLLLGGMILFRYREIQTLIMEISQTRSSGVTRRW